jgi:hypothetical protein
MDEWVTRENVPVTVRVGLGRPRLELLFAAGARNLTDGRAPEDTRPEAAVVRALWK